MNVLFDLDGTLTDPREGIIACFKHALNGLGYCSPPASDLEGYIGPPLQECFASLLPSESPEQINAAVDLYRQQFSTKGIFQNTVYPGIRDALAELQAGGARLYIATSKPRVFTQRIVDHFGLRSYFQMIYGSELNGTRSNKSELIAYILAKESIPPRSTFMVGDRAHDIIGAKANGVFPVAALWGYGTREELNAAGATVFCERPETLCKVLLSGTGFASTSVSSRS